MTVTQTPTWPPPSCPAWCRREHRHDDHPEDRIHEAEPMVIAADVRSSMLPEHPPEVGHLQVQLRQQVSEPEPWIEVRADAPSPISVTLSVVSTRRLIEVLNIAAP